MPPMPEEGVLCGPMMRYTHIDHDSATWYGSSLVVLSGGDSNPPKFSSSASSAAEAKVLLSEHGHTFWRFDIETKLEEGDKEIPYTISGGSLKGEEKLEYSFWVPGKDESMRIMFYSCNGWDSDANPDDFAGPVLWKDVINIHKTQPFHVQIGGGDQVYSDGVRMEGGPLKEWGDEMKPKRRAAMPCGPELEAKIDEWYFQNYCGWYSVAEIKEGMARIPAVNIWDDHDIIDGYGSYADHFQKAPVFSAIGRVAWKYYMLFQLQTPLKGEEPENPMWDLGKAPGLYIKEKARHICTTLGKRIVFYGLDCRTERTVKQICRPETYDTMFKRLDDEVGKAADTTHLIILLGVPIAYPRLVWAERMLSHRAITPLRLLNRKLGLAGGVFNNFDGSAELLDDLNDHWCAAPHKRERNHFVKRLQAFAAAKNIRVTILGGDVHLAAVGRFFTKGRWQIPANKDPRYMLNVISSAITNAGPPVALANFLDRRNKLHIFDKNTRENMMPIWFEDPDGKPNRVNKTTMPHRNFVIITEHAGKAHDSGDLEEDEHVAEGELGGKDAEKQADAQKKEKPDEDMRPAKWVTGGSGAASAAAPVSGTRRKYALDVSFRVEIDQKDPSGKTRAYGFVIPALETDVKPRTVASEK